MTIADFKIRREPDAYFHASRRHNPGLQAIVSLKNRSVILPIGAGYSDWPDVYRHDDRLIVVVANASHGYAGVEIFTLDGEAIGDLFLQTDYEIYDALGRRGLDLHTRTIARRLADLVEG